MIVRCDGCGRIAGTGDRADAPEGWAVYHTGCDGTDCYDHRHEVEICVCSLACLHARVHAVGEMERDLRSSLAQLGEPGGPPRPPGAA